MVALTDYSQSGEQEAILDAIDHLGLDAGWLLDIGAGDGETYSNSRELIRRGWCGVLVEPAAWAFGRLVDLYRDKAKSSEVVLCQATIVSALGGERLMHMHYSKDDHLSTVNDAHAELWSQVPFVPIWVVAMTMHELLGWFDPLQAVMIDAEGESLSLLQAYRVHMHWNELRLIVVEVESVDDVARSLAICSDGWSVVAETPNNLVLCRS